MITLGFLELTQDWRRIRKSIQSTSLSSRHQFLVPKSNATDLYWSVARLSLNRLPSIAGNPEIPPPVIVGPQSPPAGRRRVAGRRRLRRWRAREEIQQPLPKVRRALDHDVRRRRRQVGRRDLHNPQRGCRGRAGAKCQREERQDPPLELGSLH